MVVSHKHKFIFIHIPKNAGTTVIKHLRDVCGYENWPIPTIPAENFAVLTNGSVEFKNADYLHQHATIRKTEKYFNDTGYNFGDYFKFAILRNPWDRLISMYHYGIQSWEQTNAEWCSKYKNLSLDEYIRGYDVTQQITYLEDLNKNLSIDFIGRFENLQKDLNIICDKIGIPQRELPHKNKTKHKHYTEYYNEETKQIVAEKYAKDIEHFGYEFGK